MPGPSPAGVGTRDDADDADAATTPAGHSRGRAGTWSVQTFHPHPGVTVFDVRLSDYHEYFLVAAGQRSISVTMFDPSDATHPEPQTFVFAKPYGWDDTLEGDEGLLQVWQSIGVLR
jgi:hypothetical protein